MAAAAGLFNHTTAQAMAGARVSPMANAADDTSDTSSSTSTISANDFLTLLVTELQNQDPTADTDPNEYVNQLVEVNSLEQLISINQTLTGALGDSSESSPAVSRATNSTANPLATQTTTPGATGQPAAASSTQSGNSIADKFAPGNLSVPQANAAADRVAHALDGHSSTKPAAGILSAAH